MFDLVANVLAFLYDINNSYPVAIMLLTLIVLVIATPLTLSGTKSMPVSYTHLTLPTKA